MAIVSEDEAKRRGGKRMAQLIDEVIHGEPVEPLSDKEKLADWAIYGQTTNEILRQSAFAAPRKTGGRPKKWSMDDPIVRPVMEEILSRKNGGESWREISIRLKLTRQQQERLNAKNLSPRQVRRAFEVGCP